MANFKYNINELDPSVVTGGSSIPESKSSVIEQFAINNLFAKESNKLEIHLDYAKSENQREIKFIGSGKWKILNEL